MSEGLGLQQYTDFKRDSLFKISSYHVVYIYLSKVSTILV